MAMKKAANMRGLYRFSNSYGHGVRARHISHGRTRVRYFYNKDCHNSAEYALNYARGWLEEQRTKHPRKKRRGLAKEGSNTGIAGITKCVVQLKGGARLYYRVTWQDPMDGRNRGTWISIREHGAHAALSLARAARREGLAGLRAGRIGGRKSSLSGQPLATHL